jgi:hypothetical protein
MSDIVADIAALGVVIGVLAAEVTWFLRRARRDRTARGAGEAERLAEAHRQALLAGERACALCGAPADSVWLKREHFVGDRTTVAICAEATACVGRQRAQADTAVRSEEIRRPLGEYN